MKIKELYSNNEEITIKSYLKKCGVKDFERYIKPNGKYIEPYYNYDEMCYAVSELEYWLKYDKASIYIVLDNDVDGICSTMELYNYIKLLKTNCTVKILIHDGKERGLDDKKIMARIEKDRPQLVIVPDAGSNNVEQAHTLTEWGIGLIVLDHHDITSPIKDGYLVSNQIGNVDRMGSGAVVTHKFLQALDNKLDVNYSKRFIDLVALSIISDSMNVSSMQNREYLYWGLFKNQRAINPFLQTLINRFIGDKEFTQRDFSFLIIPKLNSVVRTNDLKLKQRVLSAFMGKDNYEEVADLCEEAHKKQIETVKNELERNKDKINKDDNVIILSDNKIPRSYSGLIAGKLMKECDNKPCIVGSIKDGIMIGSLRSPIPLREILNNNDLVDWASGHEQSCGIQIQEKNIEDLKKYLNNMTFKLPCKTVLKSYTVNCIPNRLFSLKEPYNALYGHGIDIPMFHIRNIKINTKDISIIGKTKRVIKWNINGIEFVIFNCLKEDKTNLKLGTYEDDVFVSDENNYTLNLEVIGELSINEWKGKKTPQVIIKEYELVENKELSLDDIF